MRATLAVPRARPAVGKAVGVGGGAGDDGGGAGDAHGGDGEGGGEFQPYGADAAEGGARVGDRRRVRLVAASELFWVLVVGVGHAGGLGECGLFGRVCGGAVEVL